MSQVNIEVHTFCVAELRQYGESLIKMHPADTEEDASIALSIQAEHTVKVGGTQSARLNGKSIIRKPVCQVFQPCNGPL
ncbi:MAG TPA: hypothetical protein VFK23_09170 [Nitrospirota bacterium]|nr:hypothetical protein [Nitrospirota bacterium]